MSSQTQIESTGLVWALKATFVNYIRRSGGIELAAGSGLLPAGEFYFELASAAEFDTELIIGTLQFRGQVRFSAHGGFLSVDVTDPWLVFAERGAVLTVAAEDEGPGGRLVLAELGGVERVPAPDGIAGAWVADVRVAATAVDFFGGTYPPGTALDPVYFRVPGAR